MIEKEDNEAYLLHTNHFMLTICKRNTVIY